MAAKETVPRGVSYYCVPVCHSYSDKVVDGKTVRLNKPPENSKARKTWIARLRGVRQNFLQSLEQGRAAYILKTKKAEAMVSVSKVFPLKASPEMSLSTE